MRCFARFFKLYKWYQIAQSVSYNNEYIPRRWNNFFSMKIFFARLPHIGLCVCIFFHRGGFFRLQDVCDILEGYGSTVLCCEYRFRCFCQVPSFSISKYVIFHLRRRNSSSPKIGEKTI